MYRVKTRNWNCSKTVLRLLAVSTAWGVERGDSYSHGDGKFLLMTSNPLKAWATWLCFMALVPWSGGWTYIVRPGHRMDDCKYRSVY